MKSSDNAYNELCDKLKELLMEEANFESNALVLIAKSYYKQAVKDGLISSIDKLERKFNNFKLNQLIDHKNSDDMYPELAELFFNYR